MAKPGRSFYEVWWRICLVAAIALPGIRALRHALVDPPRVLDDLIGHAMAVEFLGMGALVSTVPVQLALIGLMALMLIFRRGWCRRREDGLWVLRPWFASLLWPLLAADSLVIDMHPEVLALYAATLLALGALTAPASRSRIPTRTMIAIAGIGLAGAALSLAQSRSAIDTGAVVTWVLVAVALCLLSRSWLRTRDALALVLFLALVHQVGLFLVGFGAGTSAAAELRRKVLGPGDAYSFCETRDARRVFAVVPTCAGIDAARCRNDEIVEYDARDLSLTRRYRPFGDDFHGRMLHVVCLEDSLLVGMSFTQLHGQRRSENVMEVSTRDGAVLQPDVVGPAAGHRMLRHPDGSSVFVVSEYSNVILRQPLALVPGGIGSRRRAPATRIDLGVSGGQAWLSLFHGSLQTEVDAVRPSHGSGFFGEWIGGHRVHEVELDTGRLLHSYPVNSGGTHSMAVDLEQNRLLVTGLWGIDAIDLDTGRVVARRGTELGPRLPIIDTRRDRIYVGTTFGNHVWVLDRRSLAVVDKLPVGPGARNALLTSDGKRLLVGGGMRQVAWELDGPGR